MGTEQRRIALVLALALGTFDCGSSDDKSGAPAVNDNLEDSGSQPNQFYPTRLPQIADTLRAAFAGQTVDPSTYKLGILSKGLSAYWTTLQLGASQATYQINCASAYVGANDAAEQVTAARSMIAGGYKGLAFSVPADLTVTSDAGTPVTYHVEDVIAEAASKGVSVITYDADSAPGSQRTFYLGTDNTAGGRLAGEAMANLLGSTGGKVAMVALADAVGGEPGPNMVARYQSASEVLIAKGVQVIRVTGPSSGITDLATAAINDHSDLTGIMTLQATPAPTVALAVQNTNKSGVLKFVAFDFTPPIQALVKQGVVQAAVVQEQYWMGYLAIHLLYGVSVLGTDATRQLLDPWLTGPAKDILYTDLNVVTSETFDVYKKYLQSLGVEG